MISEHYKCISSKVPSIYEPRTTPNRKPDQYIFCSNQLHSSRFWLQFAANKEESNFGDINRARKSRHLPKKCLYGAFSSQNKNPLPSRLGTMQMRKDMEKNGYSLTCRRFPDDLQGSPSSDWTRVYTPQAASSKLICSFPRFAV